MGFQSGDRAHRVSAALFMGARIVGTDRAGHRVQALTKGDAVGGMHVGPYRSHAGTAGIDLDEAFVVDIGWDPYPVGVEFGDPLIDAVA